MYPVLFVSVLVQCPTVQSPSADQHHWHFDQMFHRNSASVTPNIVSERQAYSAVGNRASEQFILWFSHKCYKQYITGIIQNIHFFKVLYNIYNEI